MCSMCAPTQHEFQEDKDLLGIYKRHRNVTQIKGQLMHAYCMYRREQEQEKPTLNTEIT